MPWNASVALVDNEPVSLLISDDEGLVGNLAVSSNPLQSIAYPPSKFWPKGVTAYSRAEWAGSLALAERSASRWRKEPYVEAIEILEARQV